MSERLNSFNFAGRDKKRRIEKYSVYYNFNNTNSANEFV